jgi:putative addiction module component (TIGR02574 family)
MRANHLISEINKLSVPERIKLVEDIWQGIEGDASNLVLSQKQRAELVRRIRAFRKNPGSSIPFKVLKAELDAKYK